MREAAARLDATLARRGAALQQGWHEYLQWDRLSGQLSDGTSVDQQALAAVASRFSGGVAGLEIPAFARVRRALRRYRETVALAHDPNATETYGQQLDRFAQLLETHAQQPTAASAGELAQVVQWLEDTGQASELVSLVRHRYSHPNLYVQISQQTLSAAIDRHLHEPTPVEDVILGTVIRGQGVTQAELTAQLLRSTENVAVLLRMDGMTQTNSVGYNGPVRIWTAGTTGLAGRMRLVFDAESLSSLPAAACCWTHTRFCGLAVDKNLGKALIEKVAWKRAYRDKAQAEWIASRHAECVWPRAWSRSLSRRLETPTSDSPKRFATRCSGRTCFPRRSRSARRTATSGWQPLRSVTGRWRAPCAVRSGPASRHQHMDPRVVGQQYGGDVGRRDVPER